MKLKNNLTIKPNLILLNKQSLIKRARFSNKQIEKNHTYLQKELEQESKKW